MKKKANIYVQHYEIFEWGNFTKYIIFTLKSLFSSISRKNSSSAGDPTSGITLGGDHVSGGPLFILV